MSFLSKAKDNFHNGGVKLEVAAPPSVSANNGQMVVRVTLTSDSPRQVNKIDVSLYQITNQPPATTMDQTGALASGRDETPIAMAEQAGPVMLQPAQPVTVDVAVPLNTIPRDWGSNSDKPAVKAVSQVLEGMEKMSNLSAGRRVKYEVRVSANVEGIAALFSPHAVAPIEVTDIDTTF